MIFQLGGDSSKATCQEAAANTPLSWVRLSALADSVRTIQTSDAKWFVERDFSENERSTTEVRSPKMAK